MKIAVPKEITSGEKRVALTPPVVQKLSAKGFCIMIEKGAGSDSLFSDDDFVKNGGILVPDAKSAYLDADLVLKINAPTDMECKLLKSGACVVGLLHALSDKCLKLLSDQNVRAFALEKLPRISRAQVMDVLSSQSTIAGYAAAIMAAEKAPTLFPLLMTSAGTLTPARVLVLGAGVAGLQVIATVKRLGASVTAYDIRPEVKEQVNSLGADFLEVDVAVADSESQEGYAKEVSESTKENQQKAIEKVLRRTDVVITTALVPGKRAPTLLTQEMMCALKPGSLVIDMAADAGGNCEVTVAGQTILHNFVQVVGPQNLPSLYAKDASSFYATNLSHFLALLCDSQGKVKENLDDEILLATCITQNTDRAAAS